MNKQQYVSEVAAPVRLLSMIMMVASTLFCSTCFLVAVAFAIIAFKEAPLGPLLGCIAIFGFLTLASGWIMIRLLRKQLAANGRTVIPVWFIQVYGCLFLIGICFTAIVNGNWWLFGEGLGVAFVMIGVRSLLKQTPANDTEENKRMDQSGGNPFVR